MKKITPQKMLAPPQRLLAYLNALPEADRDKFAKRCGTSVGYIRKTISTNQLFGEMLVVRIERETLGLVTVRELRPDVADELERAGYVRPISAFKAFFAHEEVTA